MRAKSFPCEWIGQYHPSKGNNMKKCIVTIETVCVFTAFRIRQFQSKTFPQWILMLISCTSKYKMATFINYYSIILSPCRGPNKCNIWEMLKFFSCHFSCKSKFKSNHCKREGLCLLRNHLNSIKSLDFTSEWLTQSFLKLWDSLPSVCQQVHSNDRNKWTSSKGILILVHKYKNN